MGTKSPPILVEGREGGWGAQSGMDRMGAVGVSGVWLGVHSWQWV